MAPPSIQLPLPEMGASALTPLFSSPMGFFLFTLQIVTHSCSGWQGIAQSKWTPHTSFLKNRFIIDWNDRWAIISLMSASLLQGKCHVGSGCISSAHHHVISTGHSAHRRCLITGCLSQSTWALSMLFCCIFMPDLGTLSRGNGSSER